ncbi:MAG TPA: phage holin family protein [Actinomycetes bacterium]
MVTRPPDDIGDLSGAEDPRERSLPELLKRLSAETTQLVHQELDLAKVELTQKGRQAGAGAGLFGAAAAVGLAALGALTACIILALNAALPAWLAALIVAAVFGVIAAVLAVQGRDRVKQVTPLAPEQTVETVKEDVEWAKTQTRSAKR